MSITKGLGLGERLTITEIQFLGSETKVRIQPKGEIPTLQLLAEEVGPFRFAKEEKVPLWVAINLYKRNQVDIIPPEWLKVEYLERVLEKEKDEAEDFEVLHRYYYTVGRLFTMHAKDCLEDSKKIHTLLSQILEARKSKLMNNLKIIEFNKFSYRINLSAMEINLIREHLMERLKTQQGFLKRD